MFLSITVGVGGLVASFAEMVVKLADVACPATVPPFLWGLMNNLPIAEKRISRGVYAGPVPISAVACTYILLATSVRLSLPIALRILKFAVAPALGS